MIQNLIDGVLTGFYLSLGAIGLALVVHILRFANFSHAELLSLGAYRALVCDALVSALAPFLAVKFAPLSMTAVLVVSIIVSMAFTDLSTLLIEQLVFKKVREEVQEVSRVFASFGMALIIRNVIGLFLA